MSRETCLRDKMLLQHVLRLINRYKKGKEGVRKDNLQVDEKEICEGVDYLGGIEGRIVVLIAAIRGIWSEIEGVSKLLHTNLWSM